MSHHEALEAAKRAAPDRVPEVVVERIIAAYLAASAPSPSPPEPARDVDAIIERLWTVAAPPARWGTNEQVIPMLSVVAAVREAAGSEQVCRACGGSGHRNGSLRAADPFGTCPGCDGTGVQDRDAAHQFPTQHGFAVTVARALESAAEAVRRERLRIVDLIGSEFPDSMPLLAGDVIGMLQADFLDRAERSEHDDRD